MSALKQFHIQLFHVFIFPTDDGVQMVYTMMPKLKLGFTAPKYPLVKVSKKYMTDILAIKRANCVNFIIFGNQTGDQVNRK